MSCQRPISDAHMFSIGSTFCNYQQNNFSIFDLFAWLIQAIGDDESPLGISL